MIKIVMGLIIATVIIGMLGSLIIPIMIIGFIMLMIELYKFIVEENNRMRK